MPAVRNAGFSTDAGNGEKDDERQGAPPETTFEMDGGTAGIGLGAVRREDTGNQQAAKDKAAG